VTVRRQVAEEIAVSPVVTGEYFLNVDHVLVIKYGGSGKRTVRNWYSYTSVIDRQTIIPDGEQA
jgi:hypothetical protein